ncbi:uncharacterized protein LOC133483785 [Phyllopteryx taeniolatus]|uniref:uncharacterized protein LOC133483785 n=1 Tax=Phyllopteryx taeniolatus TaxID=161469 RepID=UPI002AD5AAF9|nr:uncharacterized protein LOC133483785 [Phyllopteryx taeniolatus]XP_061641486.1 uncharacterized protein LOC133483785 [Phyllopteryx taeniolatus]
MEAIFIELCHIHTQGHSLAGIRMSRWGLVMRDFGRIKQICRSAQLLAAAPIQLVEVNHRTLSQWYNRKSKEELARGLCVVLPAPTADQVAAEALPPSKPLLEKAVQTSKGLEYHHPNDTSGLAVTHRGPVLPELFAAFFILLLLRRCCCCIRFALLRHCLRFVFLRYCCCCCVRFVLLRCCCVRFVHLRCCSHTGASDTAAYGLRHSKCQHPPWQQWWSQKEKCNST